MSKTVRFGIVGLDHWYSAIPLAEAIAANPATELVGIAHSDVTRAQEVAVRLGSPTVTDSAHELIADETIDVIASFVSVDKNPEVVIAAARAGKHIISVKPLAPTLAEATEIVAAVREAGVVFLPGESRSRGSELNQLVHRWVTDGRIGTVTSASFSLSGGLPKSWPDATDGGWWVDPLRSPGGGWMDHSLYQIDRMRWMLGEEVAEVSGRVANLVHKDLGMEDYGHAILRFDGGSMTTIEDTWSGPLGGWRISSSIVGTTGALHLDTSTGRIALFQDKGEFAGWTERLMPSDDAVGIDTILKAIATNGDSLATVEDAWENFAVCLAFYEAAATGTVVKPEHLARVAVAV
jgi:predicted dehydrogenase